MAKLIYAAIASLDGYVADEHGRWDWSVPDEEVHAFVNDLERPIGTYLYGRRMYETMQYWEGEGAERESPVSLDFRQLWQAADKIVYSSSLKAVTTNRTRLARRAECWMRENLAEDVRMPDLCTVLRVSRRELEYAFRTTYDQSPRDYLHTLRLHAVRRTLLAREARRQHHHLAQYTRVPVVDIHHRGDVLLGDDQKMHAGERIDVVKGEYVFILVYLPRWQFSARDAAKNTVGVLHVHFYQ